MPTMIAIYSFIFIMGLMIGAFVNRCIDRFPKKISFRKKAFCENCNANIKWHDEIPVLSFLLLKGRCRSCGAKVNIQYPIVELANGILYVLVFMANGKDGEYFQNAIYCLMTSAFLVISIIDERTQEIPLPCNLFIGALGVIACVYGIAFDPNFPGFSEILARIIGAIVIFFVLYLLANFGLMGGGDVKLMGLATILLGWPKVMIAFFLACIVGSVIHVVRMKVSKAGRVLAMGPYLCFALWVCTFWGDDMINWYLGMLK